MVLLGLSFNHPDASMPGRSHFLDWPGGQPLDSTLNLAIIHRTPSVQVKHAGALQLAPLAYALFKGTKEYHGMNRNNAGPGESINT